ncbi:MAG: hypothetical protein ACYTHN_21475, partial [Planctomycetota bacterium]
DFFADGMTDNLITDPLPPEKIAGLETPPQGIPSPTEAAEEPGEEVEELDLGDGTFEDPTPSSTPAPSPPLETPKPKPAFVPRVPLARIPPKKQGSRLFLFEDVSQRSALFRALLYLGILLLMGAIGYLVFHFASKAL